MKSKRNLLICFIAACLCILAFTVANSLLSRHNSTNQNLYEKDIDVAALDYYKEIHTDDCEPQIVLRSYSYADESGAKYPFSSVDVTVRCSCGEYLITVENEADELKAVYHSFDEPSAPIWFMFLLQIIIVAVVVGIVFVVKYLKKKQIRLV
jgi:hypothetical protein